MKGAVLDSYAVICYLEKEAGAEIVSELFSKCIEQGHSAYLSVVNWGEVIFHAHRIGGDATVARIESAMNALPIEKVPVDQELTRLAAKVKAQHDIPYADCFAVALAQKKKAELYTGDSAFACVDKIVKIKWLKEKKYAH